MVAHKPNLQKNPSPWIGDRFLIPPEPKHSKASLVGFKKSIFATKTLFQFGLHMHGACRIEHPWSGCSKNSSGFCYQLSGNKTNSQHPAENFRFTHSFLDIVTDADTKLIDPDEEGVIYHVMYFRHALPISIETDVSKRNDYTIKYFPQTMEALRKRNLDLMADIRPTIRKVSTVDESWTDYKALHQTRNLPQFSSRSRTSRVNQN